jgi:tryptophan-rich sensory protein
MLLFFTATCFSAAAIGSAWTASSVNTWYAQLRKPRFTPPNWIFGSVWSALYLFMAIGAWLVWRNASWSGAKYALILFFVQLGLNVAWSGLFFALHLPAAALVDIFFLLAAIIATGIAFLPLSRTAFLLIIPYAFWVAFAGYLNFDIWRLNSASL